MSHGDAVGDRDRVELHRVTTSRVNAFLGRLSESLKGEVAGSDLVPRRNDADLGFAEVLVCEANCSEHAARCGALEAIGDYTATGLDIGHGTRVARTTQAPLRGRLISLGPLLETVATAKDGPMTGELAQTA